MTALLRSELRRLRSRRMLKALVLLGLVAIALTDVIVAVNSGSHPFPSRDVPRILEGTSFLLVIGGWVVGASYVGADWQAGTVTTLLTWEPRRARVLVAKTLACAIGVFVVAAAIEAILATTLTFVAAARGTTAGTDAGFVRSVVALGLRVSAVSAFGGVLGLALAMIARNTGAAIGIGFAYLAVVESLVRALRPGWQPWLIGDNANVLVLGRDDGFPPIGRSVWGAAFVLGGYAAAFLISAGATFRARDVG